MIPDNVFIPCPEKKFKLVSVKNNCPECPYSQGLIEVSQGDVTFNEKYRVLCAKPIARRMEEIEL